MINHWKFRWNYRQILLVHLQRASNLRKAKFITTTVTKNNTPSSHYLDKLSLPSKLSKFFSSSTDRVLGARTNTHFDASNDFLLHQENFELCRKNCKKILSFKLELTTFWFCPVSNASLFYEKPLPLDRLQINLNLNSFSRSHLPFENSNDEQFVPSYFFLAFVF